VNQTLSGRSDAQSASSPTEAVRPRFHVKLCYMLFATAQVPDPYRWMEDKSAELQDFLEAEKNITQECLNGHPNRDAITVELQKLNSYTSTYCPMKAGAKYLVLKKIDSKNQPVLHVQSGLNGYPEVNWIILQTLEGNAWTTEMFFFCGRRCSSTPTPFP